MVIGLYVTGKAANAADASAKTATQALHLTQRAFMIAGEIVVKSFKIGEIPDFVWQLRNVGQTPAIAKSTIVGTFPGVALPPGPSYITGPKQPPVAIGPQMPNHLPIKFGSVLTEERLAHFREHGISFVVRMEYMDQFGKEHVTRSALTYDVVGSRFIVPDNPNYFENT